MIVDDEETLCEALRTYAVLEGYDADTALSAEEALLLDLENYDLLLLDIMMDRMSGTELAARLKSNPRTAHIPIIFLTAKDNEEDMVSGLKIGADDYIVKPYSVKNVMARIEAVLRRAHMHRQATVGVECNRETLACTVDGNLVRLLICSLNFCSSRRRRTSISASICALNSCRRRSTSSLKTMVLTWLAKDSKISWST